jgi:predicted Zn-dependent protease
VFLGSRPVIARPEPELTVRGDAPPVPLAEQLGQALDVADGGDLGRAAATLEVLVKKNPVSADAHLALGATLLRAERPDEALPLLERARSLTKTSSTDEVDWFLAVALARAHNTARASSILEPLCAKTTPRASTACLGLAELKKNPK